MFRYIQQDSLVYYDNSENLLDYDFSILKGLSPEGKKAAVGIITERIKKIRDQNPNATRKEIAAKAKQFMDTLKGNTKLTQRFISRLNRKYPHPPQPSQPSQPSQSSQPDSQQNNNQQSNNNNQQSQIVPQQSNNNNQQSQIVQQQTNNQSSNKIEDYLPAIALIGGGAFLAHRLLRRRRRY